MFLLHLDKFPASKLMNHLVEVKTGEGKSIVLGLVSSILALLGFNVDCCCYSKYLSDRDYNDFKDFFKLLNLLDQIKYYTFENLFEVIINDPKELRKLGEQFLLKN